MALVQSFSHREVLGPIVSDLTIAMVMLLIFLIVFHRRVNRLVACIALAIAVVADWAHYVLPGFAELPLRPALRAQGWQRRLSTRHSARLIEPKVRQRGWHGNAGLPPDFGHSG